MIVGCGMTVRLRLNAAPAVRKTVSTRKVTFQPLAANGFDIRPRRTARRGDVLGIAIDGGLEYGASGRRFKYDASWRVRL